MNTRLAAVADLRLRLGGRIHVGLPERQQDLGACAVSTGFPEVDERWGGLPRGRLTDLVGKGSSGKLTLLSNALREALAGGAAALVDLTGTVFPSESWAAGRLLVVRPATPEQAWRALDVLVSSGAFTLVALEASGRSGRRAHASHSSASRGDASDAAAIRLARMARESATAVVACADRPLFAEHASLRMEIHPDPQGRLTVEVSKNRMGPLGVVTVPRPAFPFPFRTSPQTREEDVAAREATAHAVA